MLDAARDPIEALQWSVAARALALGIDVILHFGFCSRSELAEPGTLERFEGAVTTIVGYGTTTPQRRQVPPDSTAWDGKRRIRTSALRRVVDATWALWSIPSYVCSGDSGGGIFLDPGPGGANGEVLVANVSDGGQDCRRHNNNNRLDTSSIQIWINETLER